MRQTTTRARRTVRRDEYVRVSLARCGDDADADADARPRERSSSSLSARPDRGARTTGDDDVRGRRTRRAREGASEGEQIFDIAEDVVEDGAVVVSDVVENAETAAEARGRGGRGGGAADAMDAADAVGDVVDGAAQADAIKSFEEAKMSFNASKRAFEEAQNSFNASKQAFGGSIQGAEDALLQFENDVVGGYTQGVDSAFTSFKGALPEEFAKLVDLAKEDGDVAIALGVAAVFLPVIFGGVAEGVRGYAGSKRPAYVNAQLAKDSRAFLVDTRSSERRRADGVPDLRKDARDRGAAFEVEQFDPLTRAATANPRAAELRITAERVVKRTQWGGRLYFMGPDAAALAKEVTALANRKCFTISGDFDAWRSQGLKIRRNGSYDKNIIDRVGEDTGEFVRSGSQFVQTQIGTARTTISSKIAKANAQQKAAAVVGFLALAYAVSQYEKTLAFIGFLGIFWSIYDRVRNYESAEEFFDDAGTVLSPVAAIGSAAGSTAMKVAGAATSDEESESDSLEDLKDMELPTLADMDIPEPADGEEEEEEGEEDKTNTD